MLENNIFKEISGIVDERGLVAYVIGGYVRDWYLHRPCTDIDVVVANGGANGADGEGQLNRATEVAEELGRRLGAKVSIFKNFGTAMLRWKR